MSYVKFPCGCKFKIANSDDDGRVLSSTLFDKLPRIDISLDPWDKDSIYRVSTTCPAVWDMLGAGKTKGVFQLESPLGKQWSIKTLPRGLEDMGALGALLRPGCVSGDTKITIRHKELVGKKRKNSFSKISLRELYNSRIKSLVSLDESSNTLIKSKIEHVSYTGDKEVFSPKFKITKRQYETNERFYSLECTNDHKLLVYKRGWVELKDINLGDRVAVINSIKQKRSIGKSNFRDVCFQNYEEKCIFCDWNLGSLDVNHLDGNRNTNNYKDNLCFMCPNHHRMYSEGTISKEEALHYREDCVVNNSKHIVWAEYIGKKSLGIKDVYDIGVIGDNHNFIAGNVVVHNCLRAMSGDPPKSMTQRYADRKLGNEPVNYLHKSIASILETTFGVLTYQEQAMKIAETVAGFNKQEADVLRKAIGKKKADIMAKVEKEFLEKAEAAGVITLDEAKEIFSWIRESQKYSFNKSHAISYGLDGYWTAYIKAHFPLTFYGAWLYGANWKAADKYKEVAAILNDAKLNDIEVKTPQLETLTYHTAIVDDEFVQFGLIETKEIGPATAKKILVELGNAKSMIKQENIKCWSWLEYLIYAAPKLGKTVNEALISIGGMDNIEKMPRNRRLFEYAQLSKLSDTELTWLQTHYHTHKWKTLIEALEALKPVRKMKDKVWIGGGGTASVVGEKKVQSILSLLYNPPMKLVDTIEWIATTEEYYLGCPVTISKIDGCLEATEANTSCRDFLSGRDGYMIMALEVVAVKTLKTKSGKNPGATMAKITVRDSTATLEGVVFPEQWAAYGQAIYEGATILASVQKTKDKSLSIKKAREIS